jgi:hypothetical protein
MRHFPLSLPLLLAALVLAGCGDDSSDTGADGGTPSGSESPSTTPEGPECSEVWSGDTLPKNYDGCVRDSEMVAADKRSCASGQVVVTFDDRYYAVLGGPVNDVGAPLEESDQYRRAMRSCGG